MVEWQKELQQKGLYYEGITDGTRLDEILELHRRSTVSTFGTRRSCRTTIASVSENVSIIIQYVIIEYKNKLYSF